MPSNKEQFFSPNPQPLPLAKIRELANWARHLAKIRTTHSLRTKWFFFRQKLALGTILSEGATRDGRASDMQYSTLPPGLLRLRTSELCVGAAWSAHSLRTWLAASCRMQLHSNYPCAKIKDGRDKVNS